MSPLPRWLAGRSRAPITRDDDGTARPARRAGRSRPRHDCWTHVCSPLWQCEASYQNLGHGTRSKAFIPRRVSRCGPKRGGCRSERRSVWSLIPAFLRRDAERPVAPFLRGWTTVAILISIADEMVRRPAVGGSYRRLLGTSQARPGRAACDEDAFRTTAATDPLAQRV